MHQHRIFELFSMDEHETHDELWDSCLFKAPRFFASRNTLEETSYFNIKYSDSELTGNFSYHGHRIQKDSNTIFRYPAVMEENVEDALIRLASKRCYSDNGFVSVDFSLYELRNELIAAKKTYAIAEIRLALNVLFETSIRFCGIFQEQRYENLTYRAFAHLSIRDSTSEARDVKSSVKFSKFTSARILSGETQRLDYSKATKMNTLARHIYKFLVRFHKEITNQKLVLSSTQLISSSPVKLSKRNPDNTKFIRDALTQLYEHKIIEEWSYNYSRDSDQISLRIINDHFIRDFQA